MNISVFLTSLLWAVAAAGIAWHILRLAGQITYVTLADGRRQERTLPLAFRMLLPFTRNFEHFANKPVFASISRKYSAKLTSAGFENLLSTSELIAMQWLFTLLFGTSWVIALRLLITDSHPLLIQKLENPLCLIGPLWFYTYPAMWLGRTVAARHSSIRRALPFMLDLLTLSVEAGMDFMTALQKNVERRAVDPLSEETLRVIKEIQLGKTRREALRTMAERVNLPELRSVINALVQADELGVSIGAILRIQSDQLRQRRFERAERTANEAPVKMLFPLMFFIFPAVFLVLLGPVLHNLITHGF